MYVAGEKEETYTSYWAGGREGGREEGREMLFTYRRPLKAPFHVAHA